MPKCQFSKRNGKRCNANAQAAIGLCVFHDPDRAIAGQEARRAGGLTRTRRDAVLPSETPDHELGNPRDVARLLAQSINHLRRGQLEPRIANAVGYLAGIMLRALEQGSFEERITNIEEALGLHHLSSYTNCETKNETPTETRAS